MTLRSDEILAQRYLSLGTLYYIRRRIPAAVQLLESSKHLNPNVSRTRYLLGRIYLQQKKNEQALHEFEQARDLDPFFEDIYRYLANIYLDEQRFADALRSYMDAYVLSGAVHAGRNAYYQRQIRSTFSQWKPNGSEDEHKALFLERKQFFQQQAASLAPEETSATLTLESREKDVLFQDIRASDLSTVTASFSIAELKKFEMMQSLSEQDLRSIAAITESNLYEAQQVIFRENDLNDAIYLIEHGSVRIVKMTPFGEQMLAALGAGEFFGEMDFIDCLNCSADAVANTPTKLLSISKSRLEEMFLTNKKLAVHFYRHFWKTLSQRIRSANELLKSFFSLKPATPEKQRPTMGSAGKAASMDFENKISVLHERGLSSHELQLLAAFSKEEFFKADENIFVEGEKGDRLYIVLDGEVRISKYIPGAGEEALAILSKGEFFGEMALIDGSARSADARAHTDVTVLPIENELLTAILYRDVATSYEFLYILAKMLSRRLREINQKIYHWRMMSGGF